MNKLIILAIITFVLGAGNAASQDVRYDFDKTKDFSKYKSYKWIPIKGADQADQLTTAKLTSAVNAELATKGLSTTDSEDADLYLGFQTAIGTEKQFTSYNTGWGYGGGWGAGWYRYGGGGMSSTYGSTSTVYIGQLDLSMYDSKDKQLVWRGAVSKNIRSESETREEREECLQSSGKTAEELSTKV